MTNEQLLKDYEEYYSYMQEKYSKLGYKNYAAVYERILEILHDSENFNDFNKKFEENNMTVEIGKSRVIDEAEIRLKAYADTLVHVKRPYWVQDDSYVHYEEQEKLQETARVQMQEKVIEAAKNAQNLTELNSVLTKANQEEAFKVSADMAYKTFNANIIILNAIKMNRDAQVSDDPSIYPGYPEGYTYKENIEKLELDEPKNYKELVKVDQLEHENTYQEFLKNIETKLKSTANMDYDFEKLKEARNRRIYPVKDETLERWIKESKEIKEKKIKGGSLCQ